MTSYNVIEISTGQVLFSSETYDECVVWLDTYANILYYTIVENS